METRFLRSESPPEGRAKYRNNIPPTPRYAAASTPGGSFVEFVSTQAIKTKVITGDADLKGGGDVRERLRVRCVS